MRSRLGPGEAIKDNPKGWGSGLCEPSETALLTRTGNGWTGCAEAGKAKAGAVEAGCGTCPTPNDQCGVA